MRRLREPQKRVAQRGIDENAGVENDLIPRRSFFREQDLIVQSSLVGLLRHAFYSSVPFLVPVLFVSQQVLQVNAAMGSCQVIR
jgi:hypothetical protein